MEKRESRNYSIIRTRIEIETLRNSRNENSISLITPNNRHALIEKWRTFHQEIWSWRLIWRVKKQNKNIRDRSIINANEIWRSPLHNKLIENSRRVEKN